MLICCITCQDIANHQLQTLRPFLIETSSQFELKAFHRRQGASVRLTREWLKTAHQHLLASETLPHPTLPSSSLSYRSLNRTLQAYLSVLKGFTELIFDPPSPKSSSEPPAPTSSSSHSVLPTATALPGFPETSFLDSARLATLSTDAADTTAMYMFLMLYRQLVFFDPSPRRGASRELPKVTESDLSQLKTEIRDIASCRIGYCFTRPLPDEETCEGSVKKANDKEWKRWQKGARDVVLQIAMRATEAQNRAKTSLSSTDRPILHHQPDDRMVQLAERWLDTNLQRRSAFTVILRDRLRDAVFHRLLATTFPPRDPATGGVTHSLPRSAIPIASPPPSPSPGTITGMESLTNEIRTLANKLSKLSLIHLGVYLPLYEQDGFIQS